MFFSLPSCDIYEGSLRAPQTVERGAEETRIHPMAMAASRVAVFPDLRSGSGGIRRLQVSCRKRERDQQREHWPYKVIEVTPPPTNLGVRCLPLNMQCGESITIEDQTYTVSAVIHRYQLRKGKYEPSEKRLDVLSTGRYILNLYLENLLQQS